MSEESKLETLAPGVHRLERPSHTLPPFQTTNSFLIENGGVAVLVDAGFYEKESLNTLQTALERLHVSFFKAILLTHTHNDHCEGLGLLQEAFPDLNIYVHGNEYSRVETHHNLKVLEDKRSLMVGDKVIQAIHTPGHSPGHLSFYLPDDAVVLAGDLVAGKGSTWIGKPEGNISDYLESIEKLRQLKLKQLAPGHGEVIKEPYNKLNEMRSHRLARLEQITTALQEKPLSLSQLRQAIYPDVPVAMAKMADSSLLALIEKLMSDFKVMHLGSNEDGPYALHSKAEAN